jgi:hypothetical protein
MFQQHYAKPPVYEDHQLLYLYRAFKSLKVELEPLRKKRQRYTLEGTEGPVGGYAGDIEEITSTAAPCMRRLLASDKVRSAQIRIFAAPFWPLAQGVLRVLSFAQIIYVAQCLFVY